MKTLAGLFLTIWVVLAAPVAAQIKIEEVTTPGGLKAWLVNEPSIPFMALSIGFRGGSSLDPDDKLGAANFVAALLEEGTGDMDARAFAEAAETLAANFSFDAGRDSIRVSAQVLTENRDEALDLLRQAITDPAFNPVAVERVRGQILSNLEADLQNPQEIAGRTISALGFPDHPYGRPSKGTIETVTAITRDDLIAAHDAVMTRDHALIAVVGDITAAELGPLLDKLLGGLPARGAPLPERTTFSAGGGITVVDFPSPQSAAVWAQPGISIEDPDFATAYLINHVLGGGGFGSRLTTEVREKRGLTYGIYSYIAFLTYADYMGGSVASANATIGQAIDLVKAEWRRMAENGVTEAELESAKKNLTGSYALRFDGNAQIARILLSMQMDNFPTSYVNTRNARIEAITLEDVKRVAAKLLRPDDLRFVVVGQPEGLVSTD